MREVSHHVDALREAECKDDSHAPPDFEVGPRQWGIRIKNTPFVEHKGEMYLEVIFLRSGSSFYKKNGLPIAKSDINGLPETKEEGEQGGLDNKVIIRTFKLSSVKAVTIDGVKHQF